MSLSQRRYLPVFWLLYCLIWRATSGSSPLPRCRHSQRCRFPWLIRGGHDDTDRTISIQTNLSVEEYVAAVQAKDHGHSEPTSVETTSATTTPTPVASNSPDNSNPVESSAVSVKAHKKGNAVGDPDGEGSDSDDDDDDTEEWELLDDLSRGTTTQVQVEVELVDDDDDALELDDDDDDEDTSTTSTASRSRGGVGIRFGQRLTNNRRKDHSRNNYVPATAKLTQVREAWKPHIFVPPSSVALSYLHQHARAIEGASKARLDRRTLYACLILEWTAATAYRKFLDSGTSQQLQSALALATQPQWRRSLPSINGIRLYDQEPFRGCTLAMQETMVMALAHSLGAAMVILDDSVLQSVRQSLKEDGCNDELLKSSVLIQSLLDMAIEGSIQSSGSIARCMTTDLSLGLDDAFDERATASVADMTEWEGTWQQEGALRPTKPVPLVIFLRTEAATSLLKSKSLVELLLSECSSPESVNLVVLGKGIDAQTTVVPHDPHLDSSSPESDSSQRSLQNSAPWFGFSPNNQNASGQNDPEGSRRFNIFLARTMDPSGTPGILGAIAPPQAGNLFPHMMAMQARERLQQHAEDSPVRAELERWAQQLHQQMQSNGGTPLPPPQFFNASLAPFGNAENQGQGFPNDNMQAPPPEVIQQTLKHAMSELLDRLAQLNDEGEGQQDIPPELHKAFAQVLRNENLRRGIAENLARAAPALSDPKCQGVMLSVYVPPPQQHLNRSKLPGPGNTGNNMGGWFQKILNNHEDDGDDEDRNRNNRHKRVRTMAAAAAVMAANNAQENKDTEQGETKADRNLARLEAICRPIVVKAPSDPVRAKSWDAWIKRERGAVIFRQNRKVLNEQLENHFLTLQEHVGTRGAGSALRQMLSLRDISAEMEPVIKCAIELEAAKSQRRHETPAETLEHESNLDVDITLSQLLLTDDGLVVDSSNNVKRTTKPGLQYIHPSSLERALSLVCRISPSPAGGLSVSGVTAAHRTKEEILALAQDKHERALVSQVVSPQDIGVTYDMIGGLTDVKELLRQSITYPLKFPHLYSEGIAREAVKGVLLFGPPGTGKTMLAKAVATEGGASFLSVDASSVENKWLGESEKNAKAVFTLARRLAPCVVFIDEVDSLLSSREGTSDDSAHGTLTSVKTTMMSEWDGLNSGTNGEGEAGSDRVIVIGSTNRPFDLDEAVLRRFPRRILVDLPDLETRTEILEVTLAENRLDPNVNLTKIAERLDGYTGSDLKEVCREAVVQISHEQARLIDQGISGSAREDVTQGSLQRLRPVTMEDFEKALSKLKRSVSENGRELARVWEWNDEYGEIKREARNRLPHLANMYL